jgi:glycogen(starch) synthase
MKNQPGSTILRANTSMRIGLVSYEYPPQQGLGGVGTYMFRLAGALGLGGHEVHVITGPSAFAPIHQPNVTVHRIAAEFNMCEAPRLKRWLFWQGIAKPMSRCSPTIWHWMKWDFASHAAIMKVDKERPLDLVEAPEHAANGWMAGRIHRWPVVLRMHCPWELFVRINRQPFNLMNRLMSALERRTVANYADCLTVPSHAMRREVEKTWNLRRPPHVIPNFMDVPRVAAPLPSEDGPQRIICAGRIEPLKGQDTLVKAFEMLARRHRRAELWILGPDRWPGGRTFAQILPRLVKDESIRARIHMPGLLPLAEVQRLLLGARVAVVSSTGFESFSYSALEAMAAARPIVVTRTGALPELIQHEQTGLIVTAGEAHEIASAMGRFLMDRELSEMCARNAHATALSRYDTSRVLPLMLAAYEDAADFFYGDRPLPPRAPLRPLALHGPALACAS